MSDPRNPFVMKLIGPWERAFADEWLPLTLVLERPETCTSSACVRHVSCGDPEVQLNLDLLDRNLDIRPGETYRLTVPIRVARAKTLELKSFSLQVQDAALPASRGELVPLPDKQLAVRPSLDKQIRVRLEPLCRYAEGTKAQLTLEHHGSIPLREFRVSLGPEEGLASGKRAIRRPAFEPQQKEEVEVVVNRDELEVQLVAFVGGERLQSRQCLRVGQPPRHDERRFRFLEPRRLSIDQRTAYRVGDDNSRTPLEAKDGTVRLRGGQLYEIEIRPQQPGVKSIRLHDIPGKLHVRRTEPDLAKGCWKFRIEVSFAEVFRKPEILYYEVERPEESLTGEIPLCLIAPGARGWQVAIALGLTLTLQGFTALARALNRAEFDFLAAASEFHPGRNLNLLSLLSIPMIRVGLRCADWLQYRLRS
jgi:hypothetical protein